MNIGFTLKKVLLLAPAALVAPLLIVAAPVCTSSAGPLNLNGSVSFPDNATLPALGIFFDCPGVTLTPPATIGSDVVAVGSSPNSIFISSDVALPDGDVVFTGSSTTDPYLRFVVSDVLPPGMPPMETLSVSATPEPGSMLLFGTGLLIAGGFVRRRLLAQSLA